METGNLAELSDLASLDRSRVTAALDAGFPEAPGPDGRDRAQLVACHARDTLSTARQRSRGVARRAGRGVDEGDRADSTVEGSSRWRARWFVYCLTLQGATTLANQEPAGATRWRI